MANLVMLTVLVASITTVTASDHTSGLTLGDESLFTEFETAFSRRYVSVAERVRRQAIFSANMRMVQKLNDEDKHAVYSHLTPWADRTDAEFASGHGLLLPAMQCQFVKPAQRLTPTVPPKSSLDYTAEGATVAVKNQGKCASCWAHATTAVVEGRLKLDTGKTMSLSEQSLMDCDPARVCGGCCGGLAERALQWLASNTSQGIASEAAYPYASADGTDPTAGHCNRTAPPVARLTGFGTVGGDAQSMMAANTQYGVLAVAMDATPLKLYKSGIITNPVCTTTSNHAVAIVGYGIDNGVAYWKIRNSYGSEFGEDGYFRIQRSNSTVAAPCGISGCVVAATGAAFV